MSDDEMRSRVLLIEAWCRAKQNEILVRHTRPVGMLAKADQYMREAARSFGNLQDYAGELAAIDEVQAYLEECIEADFNSMEWLEPPSLEARRAAEFWRKIWSKPAA